jgi:hypothetical protein
MLRFYPVFSCCIAMVFTACAVQNKKTEVVSESASHAVPDWFLQKPISESYYYGIGAELIAGNPELAFENARKKALRDIAAEIETKIESNSILSRFGNSDQVRDVYLSEIRTRTSVQIEGHELVKTKEAGGRVYVLYRLDRSAYWASIQQKKQAALGQSYQFLELARQQASRGQYVSSVSQALLGLRILEPYADQSTLLSVSQGSVDLAAEFASFLLGQLSGLALQPNPTRLTLNPLASEADRSVFITLNDGLSFPVAQVPLRMQWAPSGLKSETLPGHYVTSGKGQAQVVLPNLSGTESAQLTILMEPVSWFPDSLMPGYLKSMFRSFTRSVGVSVAFFKPSVRLRIRETNSEFSSSYPALEATVKTWLLDQGYPLVESEGGKADLLLNIESSSFKGQVQGGIYISYADLQLAAVRITDNKTVFSSQLDRLKGADLSFDAARKRAMVSNRTEVQNWLNEVFKNTNKP